MMPMRLQESVNVATKNSATEEIETGIESRGGRVRRLATFAKVLVGYTELQGTHKRGSGELLPVAPQRSQALCQSS